MMPFPANGLRVKWHALRFERVFYRGGFAVTGPIPTDFGGFDGRTFLTFILSEPG